jgi:hypothetical protein
VHIDRSRLATAPSPSCCFKEGDLIITTGNEESAGRRVEFDGTWNNADRRGEKVTPALDRAITISPSRVGRARDAVALAIMAAYATRSL